jgi:S1-C subfamily serine protease
MNTTFFPLALLFALATSPLASFAAPYTNIEDVARSATPAVVSVDGYKKVGVYGWQQVDTGNPNVIRLVLAQVGTAEKRMTAGSGFFITSDGYIVTNRHVVDDPDSTYRVNTGNRLLAARVVYQDDEYDLAILKVPGTNYPTVPFADASDVVIGQKVASVGNALGKFVDSISSGQIISLDESIVAREDDYVEELDGLIATDARLYPGDSGGPLLDSSGKAIGVNVAIVAGTEVSFSIPSDIARAIIRKAGINV